MCTSRLTLRKKERFSPLKKCSTEGMCCHIKGHMLITWITQLESIKLQMEPFHANALSYYIYQETLRQPSFNDFSHFHLKVSTIDASQYWPFPQEYSIWNAAVTALVFWTADLKPHILSNAID